MSGMQITLHGGFGEKGRTSIGVAVDGFRLLLDAGVKTSAVGQPDYHPAITAAELAALDAIIVTHGHEDHVAALGWCLARGFRGRLMMTPQTRRDTDASLAAYATAEEHARVEATPIAPLPVGTTFSLGPLRITTGRSGHIAGGVWCVVEHAGTRFAYCGDVVPDSPVFAMDPLPRCDALALDASYGDDDVSFAARAAEVAQWVRAHADGCVLPTPLFGRSAELLLSVPGALALAPGMRDALAAQAAEAEWLEESARTNLAAALARASDWNEADSLPRAALLCHDAMGMAGPSRDILERARRERVATLFTGHLPAGSPGARMLADGLASWIRLPTHPTASENAALATATGAALLLGHSCEPAALERLARSLPGLRTDLATGDRLEL
jgi:Cft2 family RNA processing exonuclease